MSTKKRGLLVLEDGSVFAGQSLGAEGEYVGPIVFFTGVTGYQEVLSDPAYAGQMLLFTCPHIGNVGVTGEDDEAEGPQVRAVLARKISETPSNWRAEGSLPDWLRAHGVPALSGLDTRRLTLLLRDKGALRGALSTVDPDGDRLLELARTGSPAPAEVERADPYAWTEGVPPAWDPDVSMARQRHIAAGGRPPHVVVVDLGVKRQMLRHLVRLGAQVTVAPSHATAEDILALAPDGVIVAGGADNRAPTAEPVGTIRDLVGRLPILGVGAGHLTVGVALGARVQEMRTGHHGANHPVRDAAGAVAITAQAHADVLDPDSLGGLPVEITAVSLFDGSVEALRHRELPVWGIQYQPEGSPGPHDALGALGEFVAALSAQ